MRPVWEYWEVFPGHWSVVDLNTYAYASGTGPTGLFWNGSRDECEDYVRGAELAAQKLTLSLPERQLTDALISGYGRAKTLAAGD